jgi:hypothetical protein
VQQVWATAFSQVQGLPSGWQQAGTWTVNPFSSTLPAYSVTAPGTQGMGGVFTFQMTDVNGARFMPQAYLTFDTSLGAAGCAVILYHDSGTTEANGAWLVADDGSWIGPVSPGSSTTESNSRCQIGGAGTAGSDAGNVWTYKLAVSFTAAFAGAKNPANYHGILSNTAFLGVDYAAEAVFSPSPGFKTDQGLGQWGFYSAVRYILTSAFESPMKYVDMHEEFPATPQWSACLYFVTGTPTVGWTTPISQAPTDPGDPATGWGSWQTDVNGAFTDNIAVSWAPGVPLMSPTPAPPAQPLSAQANSWAFIVFVAGSKDTQSLGKYVPTAPMNQVRYTDHGRDETVFWTCPVQ